MEFLANLQGGIDEAKPSLFELLSEAQLANLLPPTLRYLLAQATARHPRYLIHILNSFDSAYAFLFLLVERHYLRNYGGSFTEHFYGLKRERVLRVRGGEVPRAAMGAASEVRESLKLSESDIWKNLLVMIGVPWLKRRLDDGYDLHVNAAQSAALLGGARRDDLPSNATIRQRILYIYKWFLRKAYPSVNAAYYFSVLAFQLAYLFDGTKYSHPLLYLIGTRIRRMGDADYRAIAKMEEAASQTLNGKRARPGQATSMFHPRVFTTLAYGRLLSSLRILLPTSIFALKFLEWWHASDFARQLSRKAAEGLELPAPIVSGQPRSRQNAPTQDEKDKAKEDGRPLSVLKNGNNRMPISATTQLPIFTVPALSVEESDLCPICLSGIQTATATPYGHVFCYTCIHRWVDGTHDRQEAFMAGNVDGAVEEVSTDGASDDEDVERERPRQSRDQYWESGKGRCAVTGRRILGGTEGLRRIIV